MTFGAQFKINTVIDLEGGVPGRQQAQATSVDESLTGSLFDGAVVLTFGSGNNIRAGDVIHLTGWLETAKEESAAPPPSQDVAEEPSSAPVGESADSDVG